MQKKHLIFACFGGHESELPDFGRTWTPNGSHQVNFWGPPENFGVLRFKLAMWKDGGTKIERTGARYILLLCEHGNSQKSDFLCKTLCTHKFSSGKFFGPGTYGILTYSGFRKCSWFG